MTYAFYDDHLVLSTCSQSSDDASGLMYSDIQRKIIDARYEFVLSTGRKNRLFLYKAIMTQEEVGQVQKLLGERCPQHKTKA